MYTGIVQAMLPIASVVRKPGLMTFSIDLRDELAVELETGASVAVNGVCFTVTEIVGERVSFDAMQETLNITNIDAIEADTLVNIERSAKAGVEVGGHIISGHVVDVAKVTEVKESVNNVQLTLQGKAEWMKYVFHKGFLALNGASLTVASIDRSKQQFTINLIPETLKRTNFSLLKVGDPVNIEIEHQTQVIVDTITNLVKEGFVKELLQQPENR